MVKYKYTSSPTPHTPSLHSELCVTNPFLFLLQMVFSIKSCFQCGFTTVNGGFLHYRREVYGTGFETSFTMELVGLERTGREGIEKTEKELNVKIERNRWVVLLMFNYLPVPFYFQLHPKGPHHVQG